MKTDAEAWVLVPRVPTVDMLVAATEQWLCIAAMEDRAEVIWDAMIEVAPSPPPSGGMREALTDEDVERMARAFDEVVAERQGDHNAWVIYETWFATAEDEDERLEVLAKLGDLRAERIAAMRAALSAVPSPAPEVEGLIAEARQQREWLIAAQGPGTEKLIGLIRRLADALEGRK